ncbi:hypothetical protein GCM10010121_033610 [Streptomyces brasiliensis]|uniref:Uncharacterized protein n=1 Tax=Streptomyces brasiliensis TaxID=1954 RepID=A0A917KM02_9ACTN|nr:hypothetical protein GCM10010121_033610 [Streptomyces brasiliensis]
MVGVVALLNGLLLAAVNAFGVLFGPWVSPEPLGQGMVGAAMLGTTPGLFALARCRRWEEARTLMWPVVVAMTGLSVVTLLNRRSLVMVHGGGIVNFLYSPDWVLVVTALALWAVVCAVAQLWRPRTVPPDGDTERLPLPGWSKPPLAVLGSSWSGIGTGLVALPGYWGDFVPWQVNRADAQALGVWALALGVGVLGTLAEDDLRRTRPAVLAVPGVAVAAAVVLAARAEAVHWASGPALSLLIMLLGLLAAGAAGLWLGRDRKPAGKPRPAEVAQPG